ncbi:MAG TPA: type II secretion system F family protein [Verrucomicrobiae bacterium]|nr:type II secretion system F family protein [Verrucomicrobiae bacterium]
MKETELAFLNQQLASMLSAGIPLEPGLRQLCATMHNGSLRAELQLLEKDLSEGVPLADAAARRKLPVFYTRLLQVGARSNDLPGLLTLIADYYENGVTIWTKVKGLMVYPVIVLILSFAFSAWVAVLSHQFSAFLAQDASAVNLRGLKSQPHYTYSQGYVYAPPIMLAAVSFPALVAVGLPGVWRKLAWRLPAFREAALSRFAVTMELLLRAGSSFPDAISFMEETERGTPASTDLAMWRKHCADGSGKFGDIAAGGKVFPPMFIWLVAGAGEDLATGFGRAAKTYREQATYRTNVLLYAVLPASLLFLALIILSQVYPAFRLLYEFPRRLGLY